MPDTMKFKKLLFKKTTLYLPSKPALLFLAISALLLAGIGLQGLHPFLAKTHYTNAEVLIIEGWLSDNCFQKAIEKTKSTTFKKIVVTGGPIEQGSFLSAYKTYAQLGEATLKALSVSDTALIAIAAPYSRIDRTYASAIALKQWLESSTPGYRSFTLISESTHTRRSLLLFKRALGPGYSIGSIAVNSEDYDPQRWWKSSKGVREVIDESIAYFYALLFISFN